MILIAVKPKAKKLTAEVLEDYAEVLKAVTIEPSFSYVEIKGKKLTAEV